MLCIDRVIKSGITVTQKRFMENLNQAVIFPSTSSSNEKINEMLRGQTCQAFEALFTDCVYIPAEKNAKTGQQRNGDY